MANPSVVNVSTNSAAMNFGTGSVTLSAPATAGNTLLVELWCEGSGTIAITDNNGNALTEFAGSPQVPPGSPNTIYLHQYCYTVPAGGATSLSFTFPGSYSEAVVLEVANLPSPTMQAYSADAYGYANTNPSPTATPTAPPALALGVFMVNGPGTVAPGSGWTTAGSVSTNGVVMFVEWQAVTSTAAVTASVAGLTGVPGPDAFIQIFGGAGGSSTPSATALLFL